MFWIATFMALAAAADQSAPSATLATAAVVERIAIPATVSAPALELTPLDSRLALAVGKDAAMVAAKIAGSLGSICPTAVAKADRVEFSCKSRQIDARLSVDKGKTFLDIYELRGVPWRDGPDGPPRVIYDPPRAGLGGACPGTTVAGQAECAFAAGKWIEAAEQFRKALETPERQAAAVRLGDLALIALDPATAIGWYQRAGRSGPYGRVAGARLCEFSVACFGQFPVLDPHVADLPPPLRDDLTLRRARIEAYLGHFDKSLAVLLEALKADQEKSLCQGGGQTLCRRIVLSALRHTVPRDSDLAMEVYLALPDRDKGLFHIELAEAGAEASARLGAPVFGAKLLAAVAPDVAAASLDDHLLRAAELFLAGKDPARARVIFEFIRSRMGQAPNSPRWASVKRSLLNTGAIDDESRQVKEAPAAAVQAIGSDLEAASAALKRARAVLEDNGMPEMASATSQKERP